ncbi:MAG: S1 RNA-binding domain-containing protein [Candidatus Latescibacterota bacterium]|nr:S1 RNA-binding domain-containing protein [Candidatus Latescibacterota bacterium]
MAETPQANDGDVKKDEITPVASSAAIEPQETVATANAPAGEEVAAAEASAPGEQVAEPERAPETAVAASATDIVDADEPTPAPVAAPAVEEAPAEAPVAEEAPAAAAPVEKAAATIAKDAPTEAVAAPPADEVPTEPAVVAAAAESESAPPAKASENFAEMLDAADAPEVNAGGEVNVGDKVSGVIVKVEDENSFVDYGGRGEAVIRTSELKEPKGGLLFKVGDPLEAFVVAIGNEIQISRGLSRQEAHADVLYQAFKAGMPVEGRIDAVNKWGLGVTIEGDVRGFCPISQIDTKYVENAEEYRGQKLAFKIIEFRHQGRDIVVSRRALLKAEQDKVAGSVRDQLVKGAQLAGKVTRLESFGAFVELGAGIEGLVHVSEISHQRVGHPQDVLKSGQEIKIQVLKTKDLGKRGKERISLSIKALEKDPWQEIRSQFPVGTVVEGKVEGLEDFGAFVELAEGVRGLVYISEIAERRIGHPREVLSLEDQVKVVVLDIDVRRQRLRLSIRQVDTLESEANLKEFRARQQKELEETQSNNAMLDALKRANLID